MKSVADDLLKEQRAREAELSGSERVALALPLGRVAVRRLAEARDLSEDEARDLLRRNRQAGRRVAEEPAHWAAALDGVAADIADFQQTMDSVVASRDDAGSRSVDLDE